MKFEWDENKNNLNILNHFIDFNDAINAFSKPMLVKEDKRFDYGEKRFIGIGKMDSIIIVLVWTIRNNTIRLISVRKANKKEKEIYYEHIKSN